MKSRSKGSRSRAPLELALAHVQSGRFAEAETELRRALALQPGHPDALNLMGVVLLQRGDYDRAVDCMRRAVRVSPASHSLRENLGEALRRSGDPAGARAEAEAILRSAPDRAAAWAILGRLAMDAGQLGEAATLLSRALQRSPKDLDVLLSLMVVCNRAGEYALARRYGEVGLKLRPEDARIWTNIGQAYRAERRFTLAADAFGRAGAFPPARFNLGFVRMHEHDLSGLELLEERKALLGLGAGLSMPEWQGESRPDATLLVLNEQGMGDTLLMSRFYPRLAAQFAKVVACVQAPLVRLLRAEFPDVTFVTSPEGVAADAWVPMMSLPYRLGITSLDQVPNEPWLRVPSPPARQSDSRPRVGVNWAGNPGYAYDALRSTHLATLAPLLAIEDVEWVSLHRGHLEHEAAEAGLLQPLAAAKDFLDTAEVLRTCDLVISTETAVPNLSAAMGVPTVVLTSPDYDWRWTDWYPGVRVCSQWVPGDWSGALAGAIEAVGELLVARSAEAGEQRIA